MIGSGTLLCPIRPGFVKAKGGAGLAWLAAASDNPSTVWGAGYVATILSPLPVALAPAILVDFGCPRPASKDLRSEVRCTFAPRFPSGEGG